MTGKFIMGLLADRITARYALMIDLFGQSGFLVLLTYFAGVMTIPLDMLAPGAALPLVWVVVGCFGFFPGRVRRAHAAHRAGRIRRQVLRQHHGRDEHNDGCVLFPGPHSRRVVLRRDGKLPRRLPAHRGAVLHRRDVAVPGGQSDAEGGAC